MSDVELAPSDFVALLNQTLEYAYSSVVVQGELANFRVSRNRWVYFDLKDELATVRFFGTVYQLPGPLEDGMVLKVRGMPRLHPQYGFSITIQHIAAAGEGSIKKAAQLLEAKLAYEGLFEPTRKRPLPYPPAHIGLITSGESAAYRDFIKVLSARWGGMRISLIDVQVQGEAAPRQIVGALAQYNQMVDGPDVVVMTRGGGSAEDLQAFGSEQVTRAAAASRIPTLVAVGHEVDISLAELAADRRASTPSNAAELLVPDRNQTAIALHTKRDHLTQVVNATVATERAEALAFRQALHEAMATSMHAVKKSWTAQRQLLQALDPQAALRRGYAVVRKDRRIVRRAATLKKDDHLVLTMIDADLQVAVQQVQTKKEQSYGKK